jgi:hypothetical protein
VIPVVAPPHHQQVEVDLGRRALADPHPPQIR